MRFFAKNALKIVHYTNVRHWAALIADTTHAAKDNSSAAWHKTCRRKPENISENYSGSKSLNLLMLLPEARMVPSGLSRKSEGMLETPYLMEGESLRPPV